MFPSLAMKTSPLVLAVLAAGCSDLRGLDHDRPLLPFDLGRWKAPGQRASLEREEGHIRFRTTIPKRAETCRASLPDQEAICADVDGDGLADGWERTALDRWEPLVHLHSSEPMFGDLFGWAMAVGRVYPADGGHIRLLITLLYQRDYGRCSLTGHRGDVERVALDLIERPDGALQLAGAYTAAHEYTALDGSRLLTTADELSQLEFVDDPDGQLRWRVQVSSGKHATYPTPAACAGHAAAVCAREDCPAPGPDGRDLLLSIGWAGEPPPACEGPLWTAHPFCGLGGGFSGMDRSPCAPPLQEKLLRDPFAAHTETPTPPTPAGGPHPCPDNRVDSTIR